VSRVAFLIDEWVIDPLGIGYLAAALKSSGHMTRLFQVPLRRGRFEVGAVAPELGAWKPDFFAYSVTTGRHRLWREANLRLQLLLDRKIPAIWGGPHQTFFPEFAACEGVDIMVRGEGEAAIAAIAEGRAPPGGVQPLPDVDALPWPDRAFLYRRPRNKANPIRNVMASRGCPYSCAYCYNDAYKALCGPGTRRVRAPSSVVAECEDLAAHFGARLIYFQDDLFTRPQAWFRELTELYAAKVRLPYHCHVRVGAVDRDDMRHLAATGCQGVTLAIEAGDEALRRLALGRAMGDGEIVETCSWAREAGLKLRTQNMIGIPGETWATAWRTVELNGRCRPDAPWASLFQPYPCTRLGRAAEEAGLCKLDTETVNPSFWDGIGLDLPDGRRLENLHRWFALAVRHPRLRPAIRALCALPRNAAFRRIFDWQRRRGYERLYRGR
jgi:radical SAM superfamily enzyme YgiQ (UPF0313 family)